MVAWHSAQAEEFVQGSPKVIDGNSLSIDGRPIVLHGIRPITPDRLCKVGRSHLPCASLAAAELGRIISGQPITCDILSQDEWGRDVAQCFLDERDLADELIQRGLAESVGPASTATTQVEESLPSPAGSDNARGGPEVIVPDDPVAVRPSPPPASPGVPAPSGRPIPTF